jgi:hypothetical protein
MTGKITQKRGEEEQNMRIHFLALMKQQIFPRRRKFFSVKSFSMAN